MAVRSYVIDLTEPSRLSQAYRDGLREMGLLLKTPDSLANWEKIFIRFRLPGQVRVVISAIVVGCVGGETYAVQLPQNSDARRLLEAARRYGSTHTLPGGVEMTPMQGDTASRRPQSVRARHEETFEEDTLPDDEELGEELTPTDEVLAQSIERFDRWLVAQEATPPLDEAVVSARRASPRQPTASMGRRVQVGMPKGASVEDRLSREEELWALAGNQKKKMAVSGQAAERRAFMCDPDPTAQVWVLRNPNITSGEVVEYSARDNLAPDAATFLTHSPRWAVSPAVARNLAFNPRIPDEMVPRLLSVLDAEVLAALLVDAGAPDRVAKGAALVLSEREQ